MFLIGPRNLLCFHCSDHKQIPRYARNDIRTYVTNLWLRTLVIGYHKLSLHSPVPDPAEMGTFEGKSAHFIGREFDGGRRALLQPLIDIKSFQLEAVIVIERRDDQFHALAALHGDDVGVELVFLRRYFRLIAGCLGGVLRRTSTDKGSRQK